MTLPAFNAILAQHERDVELAHATAALALCRAFQAALAPFDLHRHTITIGAFRLLVDGENFYGSRAARSNSELARILWAIDDAVANSVIPNRYFRDTILIERKEHEVAH